MLLVGNDIVDLHEPACRDKAGDDRFMRRVFAEPEQTLIREAPDPTQALWCLWAAKETAYKIISKITGPPVFSHRKFVVAPTEPGDSMQDDSELVVVFSDTKIQIQTSTPGPYVHATGAWQDDRSDPDCKRISEIMKVGPDDLDLVRHLAFSDEERRSIRTPESALIRHFCKQSIAQVLPVAPERMQIVRPTESGKMHPPFVVLDNERTDKIDVSFSHHGQWLAWVVAISPGN